MGRKACCGSRGQFLAVGKPPCPGYLVRVGETPQYSGRNLSPWRGNLRQPERPPKAKEKILTPPQSTHSCSSSCPGRGASRSWGSSGPFATGAWRPHSQSSVRARAALPSFPSCGSTAEPSCPSPRHPSRPFLRRAVPGQEGQGGARYGVPGQGSRSRGGRRGRRARAGAAGPGHASARQPHRAPPRLPGVGPAGKGSL